MTAIEPSTELREEAIGRLKRRQDFGAHLLVYVLVNLGVWGIWLLTGTGFPWPVFITFFWGIGLIMNAWDVYWRRTITEADVQREIEHLRR
jgi:hypothetical protein